MYECINIGMFNPECPKQKIKRNFPFLYSGKFYFFIALRFAPTCQKKCVRLDLAFVSARPTSGKVFGEEFATNRSTHIVFTLEMQRNAHCFEGLAFCFDLMLKLRNMSKVQVFDGNFFESNVSVFNFHVQKPPT